MKPVLLSMFIAGSSGSAAAVDCARFAQPRVSYVLTAAMTYEGRSLPLRIEVSRSDIVIVRVRASDGSLDFLNEMRDFAPTRSINGLTGETLTFSLRPVSGSISGFEPEAQATYEQTTLVNGKPIKTEHVTQQVSAGSKRQISGCEIDTLRIERVFEDQAAGTRRKQQFDYAPSLSYPVRSRIEVLTPSGTREQVIDTTAIAIDEPAPAAAPARR